MTVQSDRWKMIPSWPGYQASTSGQIRSRRTDKVLSTATKKGKHPYQRVHLSSNGKAKYVLVHRLILETFIGPCPDGLQALHLDDNPRNNQIENLKWGTAKENHSSINRKGSSNGRSKLTEAQVIAIRQSSKSHADEARCHGVSDTTIQNIRNLRLWNHL